MKIFALSSILVFLLLMGATLQAAEAPPWHWDDEVQVSSEDKDSVSSEPESDIGW